MEDKEVIEEQENQLSVEIMSKEHEDPGRPSRRTSKVWQVFNRLSSNNAECSLCNRVLSYKSSVTNLAKHIQRKHSSAFVSLCAEEDPRDSLKEFITIETGHGESAVDDGEGEEDPIRSDDADWVPPTKSARKSISSAPKKVIKKEVISSNGVDYVIYTQDQVTRPAPPSVTKRTSAITPHRPIAAARGSVVSSTPALSSPPARTPQVEEDEFSTFAKFLSQRIRALKNPYWQSCAINEINSALHRIEMRRYELPKPDCAQRFVQTDPVDPLEVRSSQIIEETDHHVVEVISQGEIM